MNRLAGEPSAYLAAAAHQPVHWRPWGEEAFAAARAADKPILLDVGAAWCHWCHVMDRESYEDPTLAGFLNEHFVCIKVDRDERPDVDARYQRAVQSLTGQGGWPLTALLTPEGDVFYGGTYFPPDERHGRQSFRAVLERVREVFRQHRDRVAGSGREVTDHVTRLLVETGPGELSPALLDQGAAMMLQLFDENHGGFGTQPKFPHPAAIEFLLGRWWDSGQEHWRAIVEATLTAMASGGMHDQIGGGFHRYSVDARWIVPHFEKMACDNSELLKVYVRAHAALGIPLYRTVAEGIVDWCMEVLADRERGGFGASQDADVGLEDDGDYFTWTEDEARAVLTPEEWEAARRRWDIWDTGEMSHDPARNVLWIARSIAAIATDVGRPEEEAERLLHSARAKLKQARDRRPAPAVDRAIYVGWNAMMCEAFLEAAAVLARPDCAAFALRTLERLWADAMSPEGALRHRADRAGGPFLLDDQVQAASAALAAYQYTGSASWLDRARRLVEDFLQRFADPGGVGFLDAAGNAGIGLLSRRVKPIQDAPTPSPNAVAALVLLRLGAMTDEQRFAETAERTLTAFATTGAKGGLFASTYLVALDFLLAQACKIVVATTTTSRSPLADAALAAYRPRKVIVHAVAGTTPGLPAGGALVCAGTACAPPVADEPSLRRTLETFGRAG